MATRDDLCDCDCQHEYGDDLGEDCTDERCGYCGRVQDS